MEILEGEKRRQKRFMRRCAVEFVADGQMYIGLSSNFSLSGLFIRTRIKLVPGTIIDMSVHLPDRSVSKLKGRVARVLTSTQGRGTSIEQGIGVAIIDNDSDYLRFVASFLQN